MIRDDIAAVLSTVEVAWGTETVPVCGFPYELEPGSWQAWSGWPVWRDTTWLNACVDQHRWYVYVVVPSGTPDTVAVAEDALREPCRLALMKVGHVELVEPASLVAVDNSATMPALRYTLST